MLYPTPLCIRILGSTVATISEEGEQDCPLGYAGNIHTLLK